MWVNFLFWLTGNLKCRLIPRPDSGPYLERYYLFSLFGLKFYIHRLLSEDPQGVHNHPWANSISLILSGGYIEEVMLFFAQHTGWESKFREVTFFNYISGGKFHRITTVLPNTFTLFIHGERTTDKDNRKKGWGFLQKTHFADLLQVIYKPYKSLEEGKELWWLDPDTQIGRLTNRQPISH